MKLNIKHFQQELSESLQIIYPENEARAISKFYILDKGLSTVPFLETEIEISELIHGEIYSDKARMLNGEPLQYVVGKAPFADFYLKVNEHVLIPRQETEEWVMKLSLLENKYKPLKILEIGTGSGCISILLAKLFPNANILAIDISENAILVAADNAQNLGIKNVEFVMMDAREVNHHWVSEYFQRKEKNNSSDILGVDWLISNPPYIPPAEKETLHINVLNYEPHLALFTPDNNDQIFYDLLASLGAQILHKDGRLFVEIHDPLTEETKSTISNFLDVISIEKDSFSRNRVIIAKRKI